MTLEQMMPKHFPDAIGVTLQGPESVLDSMVVDLAAVLQAKGYSVYSASRMVEGQRPVVFLNAGDAQAAQEQLHHSCRNSLAGVLTFDKEASQ
jgi:hypothetical protein